MGVWLEALLVYMRWSRQGCDDDDPADRQRYAGVLFLMILAFYVVIDYENEAWVARRRS